MKIAVATFLMIMQAACTPHQERASADHIILNGGVYTLNLE